MKATYRGASDTEKQLVLHFSACRFPPASFVKRFARQLAEQVAVTGTITDRQALRLAIEAYRYRRQMPAHVGPKTPPEGYETTRQRTEAAIAQARINEMKEQAVEQPAERTLF